MPLLFSVTEAKGPDYGLGPVWWYYLLAAGISTRPVLVFDLARIPFSFVLRHFPFLSRIWRVSLVHIEFGLGKLSNLACQTW
jgi:hypothetical protein